MSDFKAPAWLLITAAMVAIAGLVAGCGSGGRSGVAGGKVQIVAGENQYGNVAEQVGGAYVNVYAVDSNPNTDPHTYEATPQVGRKIAQAGLLIENGLGYDSFMGSLASASPNSKRRVIDVQHLLGLPDSTPNPHLWYDPKTMPAVANALVTQLSALEPTHAAAFRANAARFVSSLKPWNDAITGFKAKYAGLGVATTEPVADYLVTALGLDNKTPWSLQDDIMNGTDPSPQDVSFQEGLFSQHEVRVFLYNEQVTDPLTDAIRKAAIRAGVPVVGVYETMPTPGYDYQSWMMAELSAIQKAISSGASSQHL